MEFINLNKVKSWAKEYNGDYSMYFPKDIEDIKSLISNNKTIISAGGFRSYGDSAISNYIINSKHFNKIIDFDEKNGILKVQSGVNLDQLINFIVPKGWFLSVTPGTKYATVGGCIASDVHGKEHHKYGCFSECLQKIKLLINENEIVEFNKKSHHDLFCATCGGMGLTGFIIEAEIKCKKIKSNQIQFKKILSNRLENIFSTFEKYHDYDYSVAWIDTIKNNGDYRSIFNCGNFSNNLDLSFPKKKRNNINIPFKIKIINKFTIKFFNKFYFFLNKFTKKSGTIFFDKFFYPLDKIKNWYRLYGKNGFIQYQFVIPKSNSIQAITEILDFINTSGVFSSLAVLKLHSKENKNYISFPIEGYSLAMDFPISNKISKILKKIDELVLHHGGKIYLTKDSILDENNFKKFYPNHGEVKKVVKKYKISKFNSFQSLRIGIND